MNGKRSKAEKGEHERGRAPPRGSAGLVLEAVLGGGGGRSGLSAFDVCWGWGIFPCMNGRAWKQGEAIWVQIWELKMGGFYFYFLESLHYYYY